MTNDLKEKLNLRKKMSFDDYLKCYLQSIWHSTHPNVQIDETLPILIFLNNGTIKQARYLKHEDLFRCIDDSVAYRKDVVKFMYLEDLIF